MTANLSELAANVRTVKADDAELRASMKAKGWLKHLPGIKDENDRILAGNRRSAIADDLGIKKVFTTVTFGSGEAADRARLSLATASNIGGERLAKKDRVRLEKVMYDGGRGMTMQAIADVLGVNKATVSRDLEGVVADATTQRRSQRGRVNEGRPHSSGRQRAAAPARHTQAEQVMERVQQNETDAEIAEELGITQRTARRIREAELQRLEGAREAAQIIDPSTLSMSAQQKLETAIRQAKQRLEREYQSRMETEIREHIRNVVVPAYERKLGDAARVIEQARNIVRGRGGLMEPTVYKLILSCLHPDRVSFLNDNSLTRKYQKAYQEWQSLERLVNREATPLDTSLGDAMADVIRNAQRRPPRTPSSGNVPRRRG